MGTCLRPRSRTLGKRLSHHILRCDSALGCMLTPVLYRVKHPDNIGNCMHLELQKSAFGASFSAKRLLP